MAVASWGYALYGTARDTQWTAQPTLAVPVRGSSTAWRLSPTFYVRKVFGATFRTWRRRRRPRSLAEFADVSVRLIRTLAPVERI